MVGTLLIFYGDRKSFKVSKVFQKKCDIIVTDSVVSESDLWFRDNIHILMLFDRSDDSNRVVDHKNTRKDQYELVCHRFSHSTKSFQSNLVSALPSLLNKKAYFLKRVTLVPN